MMMILSVLFCALGMCAVYILLRFFSSENKPICPRCGKQMVMDGEDENGWEIWRCKECGEKLLL